MDVAVHQDLWMLQETLNANLSVGSDLFGQSCVIGLIRFRINSSRHSATGKLVGRYSPDGPRSCKDKVGCIESASKD